MMTFTQIEKTYDYLNKLNECKLQGYVEMNRFTQEIKAFFGDKFKIHLDIYVHNTVSSYTAELNKNDKIAIKSFLNGLLAEDDKNQTAYDIVKLIKDGEKSIGKQNDMLSFIKKAYYSYSDKIKFSKSIETVATAPQDFVMLNMLDLDKNVVEGVINTLRNYGRSLLENKSSHNDKNIIINNNNTASVDNKIDINVSVENAILKLEDACLSTEQEKLVKDKIKEIEEIIKSKNSKKEKWIKFGGILKWVAEQGIQVASIIVPLLSSAVQG